MGVREDDSLNEMFHSDVLSLHRYLQKPQKADTHVCNFIRMASF